MLSIYYIIMNFFTKVLKCLKISNNFSDLEEVGDNMEVIHMEMVTKVQNKDKTISDWAMKLVIIHFI